MNAAPPPHEPDRGTTRWGHPPHRGSPPNQGPGPAKDPQGAPNAGGPQPPPPAEGARYPLARWSARAAARLVDLAVIALPALVVSLIFAFTWAGARAVFGGSTMDLGARVWFLLWPTVFLLYTGYETYAVSRWKQTFGKRVMNLKVAPLASGGQLGEIPLASVMVRAALYAFPALLFFTGAFWFVLVFVMAVLIGGMAAWNRPNQQGLHDRIAGTVVLDVR
ncbi:RDD family protein [Nocardiopsis nanhaiensis]